MTNEPTPPEAGAGGEAQQPDGQAAAASDQALAAAGAEGPAVGKQLVSLKRKLPTVVNSALLRQFLRTERTLAPMRMFLEAQGVLTQAREVAQQVQQHQLPREVFIGSLVLPQPTPFKALTAPLAAANSSMLRAFEWPNILWANELIGSNSEALSGAWLHQTVAAATRLALMPDWDSFDRVLHKLLLGAAEDARAKYLASGDPEAVAEFAFEWLGFTPSKGNRYLTLQAVIDVLLCDEWRPDSQPAAQTHSELRQRLRWTVSIARSRWMPLWEHRIARRRIGTLNLVAPGSETEVGNLVPGPANVETLALGRDFTDMPRLKSLASLSDLEQEACWLVGEGLSWAEAAEAVGLPPTKGRAIQTKAKRRVREAMTREHERARTTARLVTA